MEALFIASTMARRGLLTPGNPVRVARQFASLGRWGFGLAGELRQAAARSPERVAVVDDERRVTYAELLDRSSRLAAALPVRAGDRVGLLCRNSARMLEALIGVATRGADAVLINTGLSGHQLDQVVQAQGLSALIHDDEFLDRVATLPGRIGEKRVDELIESTPAGLAAPPERPGRTIVLTSGTTGVPKGARRPTPGGFGPLCSVIDRIPLRAGERIMIAAPLFHTWGYAGMQIALALRATIVLRRRFDPADVLATMTEEQVTALVAVPVMLQNLMDVPAAYRGLRVAAVSGSALPGGLATRFMDRYGDVLYNLYGSTEASWVSIATPADLREAPATAGRPPHGTRVTIVDGQIHVSNGMLFEGYTGQDAAGRDVVGTGDLGHLDDRGRLYVDGRADDMIISGGENIFPGEVEDLLAALPQVREVAVVGVADDEWGQRLAAYLVLSPGERLDAEAVREHVRRNLARFCVPRDVTFLDELPRNATGKVVKREL
ncbi:fatty-acyl-CoA synthase [Actinoplanes philippinensis]|uniref:Acyl-CoA synthetase (AMP-forming)/AMP-acid ligase II n=1 Tax=Actinoplanes philippinensis TaxID=35752 RepID=A0A1I2HNY6_9ACTN|nr:AMP-binding protein [Actinoplanes philippinensis]GIE74186.1 fatty-acyl-CoA synthase [Actinoplanes philippinensis]SFF31519.1 Acyl-CoA synthetase (AMP-forming)/AMP-acid ligase II [Actinoplanes philippinensis]